MSERAIQHADTKATLAESYYLYGRALHAKGAQRETLEAYSTAVQTAVSARQEHHAARLGAGYLLVASDNIPHATNTFMEALNRDPNCIEALAALAAIHAHLSFTQSTTKDSQLDAKKATEFYDQVLPILTAHRDGTGLGSARVQAVGRDPDLFVEVARLCAATDPVRCLTAYRTSLNIRRDAETKIPPQLLSNIGCLEYAKQDFHSAQTRFQEALTGAVRLDGSDQEAVLTTVTYNLAVVMETLGQADEALDLYRQRILERHPEWVDGESCTQ